MELGFHLKNFILKIFLGFLLIRYEDSLYLVPISIKKKILSIIKNYKNPNFDSMHGFLHEMVGNGDLCWY